MNAQTPIANFAPDPSQDRSETRASTLAEQLDAEAEAISQRHLRQLVDMQETGMGVTRIVKQRVAVLEAAGDGEDPTAALGELGLTFNRVARGVRLSMTMEAKVWELRRARLLGLEADAERKAQDRAEAKIEHMQSRGERLSQLVDDTVTNDICREAGLKLSDIREGESELDEDEQERVDKIVEAAGKRLRRKAYAGFEDRPISAVLTDLCKDLNIGPVDWRWWADEDWALDEAEDVEGSVFAGLSP